ncbi:MAG TPA: prepilin-type N-terminal cleavage/methylation domain-containing protein [Sumerlaeia bacterium]|nr:prepilin-type N-terminal cleavage/methylation domain-containing protein [Sumerlaeia bacterium]
MPRQSAHELVRRGGTRGRRKLGFTLIELLIVVAIIAILAAIAVPNFLEAQTRAKVSRCLNDMRTMRTAMEAYRVDHNAYPPDNIGPRELGEFPSFAMLTTPVAYTTSIPLSPFTEWTLWGLAPEVNTYLYWGWHEEIPEEAGRWNVLYSLTSVGPNGVSDYHGDRTVRRCFPEETALNLPLFVNGLYDASNGTKSVGDIVATNLRVHN